MKILNIIIVLGISLTSCKIFKSSRQIDWKKEWIESGGALKDLTQQIKKNENGIYKPGNNNFPLSFHYPFDEGFSIGYSAQIDTGAISIRYYLDRGLLDHFSAFIYTNDSAELAELEIKIQQDGNDSKIEEHWYIVND